MIWQLFAELVLPTGKIRRAFAFIALSRRWRDCERMDLPHGVIL